MGYLTKYELSASPVTDELRLYFDNCPEDDYLRGAWLETMGPVKWYDHDKDLKVLSLAFPTILFTLYGKGEDDDDMWVKYYRNGKMQKSQAEIKITYEKFDPEKLQEIK